MPIRLNVPLKDVQPALKNGLVLDTPLRCSRCGTTPAQLFETHTLRLRAGRKRMGLYRQRYQYDQRYRLRIRVCESCYRADFATHPEEFEHDQTPLGHLSRIHARLFTIGTIIACAGLFLVTNLIPQESALGGFKAWWSYLTAAGLVVIIGTWLHQRDSQRRIRDSLEAGGRNPGDFPRAEVRVPVLENLDDPTAIPLEIGIFNEDWAAECSARYQWNTETYTTRVYPGEE